MNLSEIDFCVVDTETTGGRAEDNAVIDVAVVRYRDGIVYERFSSLVNPGRPIPPWITVLTGIDDSMVANAPRFAEVAPAVKEILSKGLFVAHNVPFDLGFLRHEFMRVGSDLTPNTFCTLKWARRLWPELPSKSLGALCEHLLVTNFDRHRALGDAEATVYVLKAILEKLKREHDVTTLTGVHAFVPPKRKPRLASVQLEN